MSVLSAIFSQTLGIGTDIAGVKLVKGRRKELDNPPLAVDQPLEAGVKGAADSLVVRHARQRRKGLGQQVDLSLFVLTASHGRAAVSVCAQIPFAIIGLPINRLFEAFGAVEQLSGLIGFPPPQA